MRLAPIALLFLSSCTSTDHTGQIRLPASTRGPVATVVDSVTIDEPDSLPLGNYATSIARSGAGDLLILDPGVSKVLRFNRSGQFVGAIGRKGEGPGEFEAPWSMVLLPGDSLLAVADPNRAKLVVVSAIDGTFRRELGVPTFAFLNQHWSLLGDTMIVGMSAGRSAIGKWRLGGDTIVAVGRIPLRSARNSPVYGETAAVPSDSGYTVLYPVQPGLFLLDQNARDNGFVRVPLVRRLGEPKDLLKRQQSISKAERGKRVASYVSGLHRLQSGEWLLLHMDFEMVGERGQKRAQNIRVYASIVSADFRRACVDGLLPLSTDVAARPLVMADTLFILTRSVGINGVLNRLMALTLSTATCDWQDTGGVVAPPKDSL